MNGTALLCVSRLVEDQCDYVDLNLGCPQRIASRGQYGAFLMDKLPLVEKLVKNLVAVSWLAASLRVLNMP
jgi:tRNA-dihydrouridine synthase 1